MILDHLLLIALGSATLPCDLDVAIQGDISLSCFGVELLDFEDADVHFEIFKTSLLVSRFVRILETRTDVFLGCSLLVGGRSKS